jgi:ATP-dependent helicase/nuclease subunit B
MFNLLQALADGATVVTPNNRLARDVAARHDAAQRATGAHAWAAAKTLPFALWLEELWRAALAAGVQSSPPVLLDASATRALWHAIVAQHGRDWLNARGAARHAADAWATFHAWRDAGESVGGIASRALHDDPVVFAQWAARYQGRLAALEAIDDARLPDALIDMAYRSWAGAMSPVVLHGFMALTAQQRRLIAALRNAGMVIDEWPAAGNADAIRHCVSLPAPRDELLRALGYARARLLAEPQARIAIVVADLDERRDEVIAVAEETLCPGQLLMLAPDAPRSYGISLGEPLSTMPIVACALDLIALGHGRIAAATAASIFRSPFLPDARGRWAARAEIEHAWLDAGRREVGWHDALSALSAIDPSLHQRFAALKPLSATPRLPREWARDWSNWLASVGWPGTAALSSGQWQAREAWSAALARFASIGTVTGALSALAALDALRVLLTDTLFQPEAPPAPIQILGVLEAAGLSFDYAWLAGFDALRWPGTAAPNPLLPLAWQQARGVPRAHPEAVLAQARAITSVLCTIAPEIIVSHATTIDDAAATISPLFADWLPIDAAALPPASRFTDSIDAPAMERITEAFAPPVPEGASITGGAALFDSQSACPFQAYARYRLGAKTWPECPDGLSPAERGEVLHAMLKAFWDVVGDQAALLALDAPALSAHIDAAVAAGKAKLGNGRWRELAPATANAEASRLAATLAAWIDEGERPRPPFRVRGHEQRLTCEIDGLALRMRIDRIDELDGGGLAIIDYKSGNVVPPVRWFRERPDGLQLAVYAEAFEHRGENPIRALAYAQVKAGAIAVAGLVETSALWPALQTADAVRPGSDWFEARGQLRERLAELARDIRSGVADVAPRTPAICRYCGLQPLCRVQVLDDGTRAETAGE